MAQSTASHCRLRLREFYPTIDTILWGRKTYDWIQNYYKNEGHDQRGVRYEGHQLRVLAQATETAGFGWWRPVIGT